MYKLLKINGAELPNAEGGFTVSQNVKYNTYEAEDGSTTVEQIRVGIIKGTVSYKGLLIDDLKEVASHLTLVSDVEIYNPLTDSIKVIKAKIEGISMKKIVYKNNVNAWSLDFTIEEL